MRQTQSIIVHGKVQGVYFRQSTLEKALDLHIVGTVRNLKNGSVEIIATSDAGSLQQLIEWCHTGPSHASVKELQVKELALQEFSDFTIIG